MTQLISKMQLILKFIQEARSHREERGFRRDDGDFDFNTLCQSIDNCLDHIPCTTSICFGHVPGRINQQFDPGSNSVAFVLIQVSGYVEENF